MKKKLIIPLFPIAAARGCQTGNPAVPDRRPGPSSAAEFRIRGQGYQLCDAPRSGQERRHRQIAGQRGLPARTEAAREKTRGSGKYFTPKLRNNFSGKISHVVLNRLFDHKISVDFDV